MSHYEKMEKLLIELEFINMYWCILFNNALEQICFVVSVNIMKIILS